VLDIVCNVAPCTGVAYAQFTSDSSGNVPSGVTFTVPQMPSGEDGELGTVFTWNLVNAAGTVIGANSVQFVYGATATLSASSGAAGSTVTVSANGLNALDGPFSIVFNCIPNVNVPGTCTGLPAGGTTPANLVVGALLPNALGFGSSPVTIPASAASGTYVIQLVCGDFDCGAAWQLAIPVTFTVGAPSGIGVNTLTPGAPTQTTLQGNTAVSLSYTNTLSTSITIIGYAVVTNALGQTVAYTTASATLAASGSQTLYFVLAGLPAGTYTVTIFAISSTGVVVSPNTTATATVS